MSVELLITENIKLNVVKLLFLGPQNYQIKIHSFSFLNVMHVQYNYNNNMKLRIQLYTDIIAPKFKTIANIDLS